MRIKGKVFTLGYLAKLISWRQRKKNTDTIIFIYGARRTGKTNLGLKILIRYLEEKRKDYANKNSKWNPPHFWKAHFKKYFGITAEDTLDKIQNNEHESYIFLDEGLEIFSWHNQMDRVQQELSRMYEKCGKKKITTIIILPNLSMMQKNILSVGHYLFWITREPDINNNCNQAFVLKNHENAANREKNPFGINKILKDIEKKPSLDDPKRFETYLENQNRYVGKIKYRPIDSNLYDIYEELLKDPIIANKKNKKYVNLSEYKKIKYSLDTMLYNLDMEGQKVARICNLLRDKYGRQTVSRSTVKKWIEDIHALEYKPETLADEEEKKKELYSESNVKDLKITA